jgi:hypothetical protein
MIIIPFLPQRPAAVIDPQPPGPDIADISPDADDTAWREPPAPSGPVPASPGSPAPSSDSSTN